MRTLSCEATNQNGAHWQRSSRADPVKTHTHLQHSCPCLHVDTRGSDGH